MLAERVGFEPTVTYGDNAFREHPIQPLWHLSLMWAVRDSNPRPPRCKRGTLAN